MLPRHHPPFTLISLFLAQIRKRSISVNELEKLIAEKLEVPHAIMLPSARFGIWAGLEIALSEERPVATPVLTCSVVHEAVMRSRFEPFFIDCKEDSFLMDLQTIPINAALVLCEIFGQTYPMTEFIAQHPFRIWDMAMTFPERQLLSRMRSNDLGLLSFGLGKALYTGWGGLALTWDSTLAREMRRLVVKETINDGAEFRMDRFLSLALRVAAHWGTIYGGLRWAKDRFIRAPPINGIEPVPPTWFDNVRRGAEWTHMPSHAELRTLALTLERLDAHREARRTQEHWYRQALSGIKNVTLPAQSASVMSHFTIRVGAGHRDNIRQILWKNGIDTGVLFGFPRYCNPGHFPQAWIATRELINLPMGTRLTRRIVDHIADVLSSQTLN